MSDPTPTPTPTIETTPTTPAAPEVDVRPKVKMTRDEARAAILNAKGATRPLTIFGVDLEMREPPIQDVIDAQQHTDQKQAFANLVIKFSYLPGESEPLFTDEDAEQLLNMPFGKDARQLMAVIQDFMGVTPDAASKSEASE